MAEVVLHIYDVMNSGSDKTNSTILQINKIFKDGIGLGGIFHSAVQDLVCLVAFLEKNPMYTYRESIVLGTTDCSIFKVNQILRELSRKWLGYSYDLLGVPKLSGWVNRFAHASDAAMEVAGNTAVRKVAYRFLVGVTNNATASPESAGNSNRGAPRFQTAWFKNLITTGAKPSSSSDLETKEEDALRQHQQPDAEPQQQQNNGDVSLVKSQPLVNVLQLIHAQEHGSLFERWFPAQQSDKYKSIV
ncbi:unnamed protein product [Malus baccata var. baccata]